MPAVLHEVAMAKASPGGDEAKRPIKLSPDIHEMIEWVKRVEGIRDSASLIEPMFRDELTERYESHKSIIDQMKAKKAADDQHQAKQNQEPTRRRRRAGGG